MALARRNIVVVCYGATLSQILVTARGVLCAYVLLFTSFHRKKLCALQNFKKKKQRDK